MAEVITEGIDMQATQTMTTQATDGRVVQVTYTADGKRGGTIAFQWGGGRAEYYADDVPRPTGATSGLWLDFGAAVALGAVALGDVWAMVLADEVARG
jgi:hypothetical protein